MSDQTSRFVGNIPENYDHVLGPVLFADYAEHTARLVAGYAPSRVLETGAGTGIVTRRLRDLLPATTRLVATDLNPPMLDVARKKFRPEESIEFQQADAMALPFADTSFDAVVCQSAPSSSRTRRNPIARRMCAGARGPLCVQRLGRQLQPHAAWLDRRRSRGPIFPDRSAPILTRGGELQQNRPD